MDDFEYYYQTLERMLKQVEDIYLNDSNLYNNSAIRLFHTYLCKAYCLLGAHLTKH